MKSLFCLVGSICVCLLLAFSPPPKSAPGVAGSESAPPRLSRAELKVRYDQLVTLYLDSGFESLAATRLASIVVYGIDPDAPIVQGMGEETCYWVDVTVFYCDAYGELKSKVLHIGRPCWNTLIGTIGAPCPQVTCNTGEQKVLEFNLVSGCDGTISTGCVVVKLPDGYVAQSGDCDGAPPLKKCTDCFPTSLCSAVKCIPWSGDAPSGCPNCSN